MELVGKNAIVTGAARGIGRGIALKLAEAGANVALVDLGNPADPALTYNLAAQTDLQETAAEVRRREVKAVTILADVTHYADCQRMAAETAQQLGSIDILVNNAGIIAVGAVADFAEEQWDRVMAVNAKGPFLCAKACIPSLTKNKEGAIVNIASVAGKQGRGGASAYCASKFAVRGFTESLRNELEGTNIFVTSVHPGGIKTAIAKRARLGARANASLYPDSVSRFDRVAITTAEDAAARILKGVEKYEPRVLIGSDCRQVDILQRLRPVGYWKMLAKKIQDPDARR